jgi:hypothetical protein
MKSLSEICQKSGGETMETIRFSTDENFVSIIFSLFRKKGTKNGKIGFWTFLFYQQNLQGKCTCLSISDLTAYNVHVSPSFL